MDFLLLIESNYPFRYHTPFGMRLRQLDSRLLLSYTRGCISQFWINVWLLLPFVWPSINVCIRELNPDCLFLVNILVVFKYKYVMYFRTDTRKQTHPQIPVFYIKRHLQVQMKMQRRNELCSHRRQKALRFTRHI